MTNLWRSLRKGKFCKFSEDFKHPVQDCKRVMPPPEKPTMETSEVEQKAISVYRSLPF